MTKASRSKPMSGVSGWAFPGLLAAAGHDSDSLERTIKEI